MHTCDYYQQIDYRQPNSFMETCKAAVFFLLELVWGEIQKNIIQIIIIYCYIYIYISKAIEKDHNYSLFFLIRPMLFEILTDNSVYI